MRRSWFVISLFFAFASHAQVQLQTGAAQFSLPLYSYADPNNRIGFGITLSYLNGNGLKVNEMASPVGTGWVLQYGGEVVRLQNGEADDQYQPIQSWGAFEYKESYYPNGYLYAEPEYHPSIPVKNGASFVPKFDTKVDYRPRKIYLADREQDVFQFSFNGRSGQFVIGKNGFIQSIGETKLRIEKVHESLPSNVRTTISGFVITDETGIRYVFKERELSEVLKYDHVQKPDGTVQLATAFDPTNACSWLNCKNMVIGRGIGQYTVSKWLLSEIQNPLTNQKIVFSYEAYNFETHGEVSFAKSRTDGSASSYSMSLSKLKGIAKRPILIECYSGEKIKFNYSTIPRQDLPYDKSLDNIAVLYGTVTKYHWKFALGYSGRNSILPLTHIAVPLPEGGSEETPYLRLCLLGIQKYSATSIAEPSYEFSYNLGDPNNQSDRVPARFSFLHDHWGYSNATDAIWGYTVSMEYGNSSNMILNSVANYLNAVDDPMTKRQIANKLAQNGILKSIKYPTGGKLSFEYEQNTSFHNGANVPMGGVRVRRTVLHDGFSNDNDIVKTYNYTEENGNSSGWGFETAIYSRDQDMTVYKTGGNVSSLNLQSLPSSIVQTAGQTFLSSVVTILGPIVISYLVQELFDLMSADYQDYVSHNTYSTPVNFGNPLPFQYKRVEVYSSETTNNGKIVYGFTSRVEREVESATVSFPYANKQRFGNWVYGLPKYVTTFDNNGNISKKTENVYSEPTVYPIVSENFISRKWSPQRTVIRHISHESDYLSRSESDYIVSDVYYPLSGRVELKEIKEYSYNSSGNYAMVSTKFFYNGDLQVARTETQNSKGELIENHIYYPNDYNIGGAIQVMKNNNILNVPIATQTVVTKNGSSYGIDGTINEVGVLANGDVKTIKSHNFQSTLPVPAASVAFSPNNLIPNNQYYKEQQQINYSAAGIPLLFLTQDRKAGKLFGYGDQLVIADISNASGNEAFYDSFEEEGIWNGVGYDNLKTHSGRFSGRIDNLTENTKSCLSNKWLNISLTQDTKFKFSGWVSSDHPHAHIVLCMQNASGQTSYDYLWTTQANKWIFLEKEYTVPSSITKLAVRIDNRGALSLADYGGTVWFDDIRLHPSHARMTTYTYDPLIGLTSKTDINNRSIHYEYDGVGRLTHVLDNERNILKKYCYNFAGQPEACPAMSIGNGVKSKVFRKNNCQAGAGFYGTEVTYIVPANKYFGPTQPAADALAQADIDREGQAFANLNGTCLSGFTNEQRSGIFTRNNCTAGKIGSQLTYIVPAGKHAAADQASANTLADQDLQNNGQAYANANGTCLYYSSAVSGNFYSRACASNQTAIPYPVTIAAGAFTSTSSPSDATALAQWEAQRQADLNGQCSNNPTTIYARLEVELTESGQSSGYNSYFDALEDNYNQWVSMYLRFYSDAACTQPLVLPQNVTYSVQQSGWYETESSFQFTSGNLWQGTAQAGVSEVYFDNILPFEYLWAVYDSNGYILLEKAKDDYSVTSIGTNCTLRPAVYPQHTVPYQ